MTTYTLTLDADELQILRDALAADLATSRTPWHSGKCRGLLRRIGWEAAGWPVALTDATIGGDAA
jgi:hypothetical protein